MKDTEYDEEDTVRARAVVEEVRGGISNAHTGDQSHTLADFRLLG